VNIIYYNFDYEYFTNILSLKMEVRDGGLSLYESLFSRLYGIGAIDRTKKLPKSINTVSKFPIPSVITDLPSYSEIVEENAQKIKSSFVDDLPAIMYYDGSIDATVALLAMVDVDVKPVLNVSESVYNTQKDLISSLGLETVINEKREYGEDIKHYNIINYALGKVINDCDYAYSVSNEDSYLNLGVDEFKTYLESLLVSDTLINTLDEQFNAIISISPVDLNTVYSVIKWTSFNFAYQGLTFDKWYDNKTVWRANQTVHNFYNTDKFQRYSLNNINKEISVDNFKIDALDYIKSKTDKFAGKGLVYIDDTKTALRFISDEYKPFRDIGFD